MSAAPARIVVNVDGGSRGNPGPAAIAAVASESGGGILAERSERIGRTTNNVAEYRAMLLGIELARELGAKQVDLVGDSQLIVRQVRGEYKVKDANLKPLRDEVVEKLQDFEDWTISDVRRAQNEEADRLVNEALDA